ncbi:MAG TPA: ABC transporter ATP-binding protein [Gemmatimonadales bacterium]|jgi:spermidine/putrescine transport system ATP-binding protein
MPPPVLSLDRVSRRFRGVAAVDQVSLDIERGEFFSLLGPSGCGKTTTLRLIAGFDEPEADGGTIRIEGDVVNGRRPYQRPISMVFQNYALFPHLSVADNVAFGLVERRVGRDESRRRVERALELTRLDPAIYAARHPAALSGGERQRVALARALVLDPPILLLDEPLAALDLRLRKAMQLELRQLNRTLGITFILVTHDQEEALVMSDRVAVMSAGRVVQIGSPTEIYNRPRTAFVADFIGEANRYRGTVRDITDGHATVSRDDGTTWRIPAGDATRVGTAIEIVVRPEWQEVVRPGMAPHGHNALAGTVIEQIFRGDTVHLLVALESDGTARVALRSPGSGGANAEWSAGQAVLVTWAPPQAHLLAP